MTMGVEDYRFRLTTTERLDTVSAVLNGIPGVRPDPGAAQVATDAYFMYESDFHLIELEARQDANRVTLSLRFSLCHPPSVDDVYVELILRLSELLNASFAFPDDINASERDFTHALRKPLASALATTIAAERAQWQAMFGTETAKLSCQRAIERYVYGK